MVTHKNRKETNAMKKRELQYNCSENHKALSLEGTVKAMSLEKAINSGTKDNFENYFSHNLVLWLH